jgi:hypothetical protein
MKNVIPSSVLSLPRMNENVIPSSVLSLTGMNEQHFVLATQLEVDKIIYFGLQGNLFSSIYMWYHIIER